MASPSLYQINTRVVLQELRQQSGRHLTLADWPADHLDSIRDAGFDWVWLLGVWQTGAAGQLISRTNQAWQTGFHHDLPDLREQDITGSPFAIQSYSVHEDLGGESALQQLRQRLAKRGLRLMLDFVPNHVALDHRWVGEHPEYFIHGDDLARAREPNNYVLLPSGRGPLILAHGRDPYFSGWPDTLQLNYRHPGLRAAQIHELLGIAAQCDGVRCDMAMLLLPDVFQRTWGTRSVPIDGSEPVDVSPWPEAISRVRTRSPTFVFLAEVYWDLEWTLQQQGFDFTYDKRLYDRLRAGFVGPIKEHLQADLSFQSKLARFLENHDEERAAAILPPALHQAAALVTYTTPGLRFFHEGQLEGRHIRVSIHLGRRAPEAVDPILQHFYHRLLQCLQMPQLRTGRWQLRPGTPAWENNATWQDFLVWTWEPEEGWPVLVCINFSSVPSQCYVPLPIRRLRGHKLCLRDRMGSVSYVRDGDELTQHGLYLDMPAWDYHLFSFEDALHPTEHQLIGSANNY